LQPARSPAASSGVISLFIETPPMQAMQSEEDN
jgi:hypothetical protein